MVIKRFLHYCKSVAIRTSGGGSLKRALLGTGFFMFLALVLLDINLGILPLSAEDAQKKQAELEEEFRQVPVPGWATPLNFQYSPRRENPLIGRAFISNANFAEIKKFYDAELVKQQWVAKGEASTKEWGVVDYGGHLRLYCRWPYEAEIFFPGDTARYGWTYTLTFSWPSRRECWASKAR